MSFGMFPAVGKRGRRRGSLWKGSTVNERSRGNLPAAFVWANDARGCLVDAAASRLPRIVDLHRVFNVGEPRKTYVGERSFPLIMQNVHRYFLYLALVFILILTYDVWKALWFVDPTTGKNVFGIGVGTVVLAINVVLLSGYTFGCHSLRHLAGGFLDQFSKSPTCYRAYACVTCFNRRHMLWAWLSLFWVGFTDLYVRFCSMGIWHDWRII